MACMAVFWTGGVDAGHGRSTGYGWLLVFLRDVEKRDGKRTVSISPLLCPALYKNRRKDSYRTEETDSSALLCLGPFLWAGMTLFMIREGAG